jgi:methyltransferase (TIGR00027 family)
VAGREASRTAVLVCQGRALADGRIAPGRFADPVAYGLLRPQERVVVDQVRADRPPSGISGRLAYEVVRGGGALMAARTVAIDDAVRAAGHDQLVVLGAGLDARAWRMPELAAVVVFVVVLPASQRDQQDRDGERAPLARSVRFVAVDMTQQRLAPALRDAGYDSARPATWVWEGVVPYLTESEVVSTVAQVAALCAPGSTLVVNYQERAVVARLTRLLVQAAFVLARQPSPWSGEPWRSLWSVQELGDVLTRAGFEVSTDVALVDVAVREGIPAPGRPDYGRVVVARTRATA